MKLQLVCQVVSIVWVDEDKAFNIGIKSVLDGKPMDGISSLRIHSGPDMTQVARPNKQTLSEIAVNDVRSGPMSYSLDGSLPHQHWGKTWCNNQWLVIFLLASML